MKKKKRIGPVFFLFILFTYLDQLFIFLPFWILRTTDKARIFHLTAPPSAILSSVGPIMMTYTILCIEILRKVTIASHVYTKLDNCGYEKLLCMVWDI